MNANVTIITIGLQSQKENVNMLLLVVHMEELDKLSEILNGNVSVM